MCQRRRLRQRVPPLGGRCGRSRRHARCLSGARVGGSRAGGVPAACELRRSRDAPQPAAASLRVPSRLPLPVGPFRSRGTRRRRQRRWRRRLRLWRRRRWRWRRRRRRRRRRRGSHRGGLGLGLARVGAIEARASRYRGARVGVEARRQRGPSCRHPARAAACARAPATTATTAAASWRLLLLRHSRGCRLAARCREGRRGRRPGLARGRALEARAPRHRSRYGSRYRARGARCARVDARGDAVPVDGAWLQVARAPLQESARARGARRVVGASRRGRPGRRRRPRLRLRFVEGVGALRPHRCARGGARRGGGALDGGGGRGLSVDRLAPGGVVHVPDHLVTRRRRRADGRRWRTHTRQLPVTRRLGHRRHPLGRRRCRCPPRRLRCRTTAVGGCRLCPGRRGRLHSRAQPHQLQLGTAHLPVHPAAPCARLREVVQLHHQLAPGPRRERAPHQPSPLRRLQHGCPLVITLEHRSRLAPGSTGLHRGCRRHMCQRRGRRGYLRLRSLRRCLRCLRRRGRIGRRYRRRGLRRLGHICRFLLLGQDLAQPPSRRGWAS